MPVSTPIYVARKDSGAVEDLVLCSLDVDLVQGTTIDTLGIAWSDRAARALQEVRRALPRNLQLPYSSLHLSMQVHHPTASFIEKELEKPWDERYCELRRRDSVLPYFMYLEHQSQQDALRSTIASFNNWVEWDLRPWTERRGLDPIHAERLLDLNDDLFTVRNFKYTVGETFAPDFSTPMDRYILKSRVLQLAGRQLEGKELFNELGPVKRVFGSDIGSNQCELMTWPTEIKRGHLSSMVAVLTFETLPFRDRPIINIRARRRQWLSEFRRYYGRRSAGCYTMNRLDSHALHFRAYQDNKQFQAPVSSALMRQILGQPLDMSGDFEEVISEGFFGNSFIGASYHSGSDGYRRGAPGSGASPTDNIDLRNRVGSILGEYGFRPLAHEKVAAPKNWKRGSLFNRTQAVEEAPSDYDEETPSSKDLEKIRDERNRNIAFIRREFPTSKPVLVLVSENHYRERLEEQAALYFGDAVKIVWESLPLNTHGVRGTFDDHDMPDSVRHANRVKAWTPLAERLKISHQGSSLHVLVQAPQWFRNHKGGLTQDDDVNKSAGRHALATIGNANVQYLVPPDVEEWEHRAKAALYDLLFGHSAVIQEVQNLVRIAFENPETAPRSIIGISVVEKKGEWKRTRGGTFFVATRIDTSTGLTTARLGWFESGLQMSDDWEPFRDTLRRVSSTDYKQYPSNQNRRREIFLDFVDQVVKEACRAGEQPLVLINADHVASDSRSLWQELTDTKLGGTLTWGHQVIGERWKGARIFRIRQNHAGRILVHKTRFHQRITAEGEPLDVPPYGLRTDTLKKEVRRISSSRDGRLHHYWITPGYLRQMQSRRGQSVFRPTATIERTDRKGVSVVAQGDIHHKDYRLPSVIEATAVQLQEGDDPDLIATMLAYMKDGYTHTNDTTALPQPLFFETKVKDYMCPYVGSTEV